MVNQTSDDMNEMGFINKTYILEHVTQEEIFALVFGFEPTEHDYVTSPIREDDNSPGCYFENFEGRLRYKDYADPRKYGRIKLKNLDCFDMVQVYFQLPNFFETLRFIKTKLIDNKEYLKNSFAANKTFTKTKKEKKTRSRVKIFVSTRDWFSKDKAFWSKYGISKDNLIEDKVFPLGRIKVKGSKRGDYGFPFSDIAYAFTDFEDGRKKIYRPYYKKKKFITNCSNEDIGDINRLAPFGRQLIISKSYKDCRVLRNYGLNSVWFQNEGQTPTKEKLKKLVQRFERVIVLYDNDKTGIEASNLVSDKINTMFPEPKSAALYLPPELAKYKISDPSDLYHKKGKEFLTQFLIEKRILL